MSKNSINIIKESNSNMKIKNIFENSINISAIGNKEKEQVNEYFSITNDEGGIEKNIDNPNISSINLDKTSAHKLNKKIKKNNIKKKLTKEDLNDIPIPIFACIYCSNDYISFKHLSNEKLSSKYYNQTSIYDMKTLDELIKYHHIIDSFNNKPSLLNLIIKNTEYIKKYYEKSDAINFFNSNKFQKFNSCNKREIKKHLIYRLENCIIRKKNKDLTNRIVNNNKFANKNFSYYKYNGNNSNHLFNDNCYNINGNNKHSNTFGTTCPGTGYNCSTNNIISFSINNYDFNNNNNNCNIGVNNINMMENIIEKREKNGESESAGEGSEEFLNIFGSESQLHRKINKNKISFEENYYNIWDPDFTQIVQNLDDKKELEKSNMKDSEVNINKKGNLKDCKNNLNNDKKNKIKENNLNNENMIHNIINNKENNQMKNSFNYSLTSNLKNNDFNISRNENKILREINLKKTRKFETLNKNNLFSKNIDDIIPKEQLKNNNIFHLKSFIFHKNLKNQSNHYNKNLLDFLNSQNKNILNKNSVFSERKKDIYNSPKNENLNKKIKNMTINVNQNKSYKNLLFLIKDPRSTSNLNNQRLKKLNINVHSPKLYNRSFISFKNNINENPRNSNLKIKKTLDEQKNNHYVLSDSFDKNQNIKIYKNKIKNVHISKSNSANTNLLRQKNLNIQSSLINLPKDIINKKIKRDKIKEIIGNYKINLNHKFEAKKLDINDDKKIIINNNRNIQKLINKQYSLINKRSLSVCRSLLSHRALISSKE